MLALLNQAVSLFYLIFLLTYLSNGDIEVCEFSYERADIILAVDMNYRINRTSETSRQRFNSLLRSAMLKLQFVDEENETRSPNEPTNLVETNFAMYTFFSAKASHFEAFNSAKYIRRVFVEERTQSDRWIKRVNESDVKTLSAFITKSLAKARASFAKRQNSLKILYLFTEYSNPFPYENEMDSHLIEAVKGNITVVIISKYRRSLNQWENHIADTKELKNKVFFEQAIVDRESRSVNYIHVCRKYPKCNCNFKTTDCHWSNDAYSTMETCVQLRYLTEDQRKSCQLCPQNHSIFCSTQDCKKICESLQWTEWSCRRHKSGKLIAQRTRNVTLPMQVNRQCVDLETKPCSTPIVTTKKPSVHERERKRDQRSGVYITIGICCFIVILVFAFINITMYFLWKQDANVAVKEPSQSADKVRSTIEPKEYSLSLSKKMAPKETIKEEKTVTAISKSSGSTFNEPLNKKTELVTISVKAQDNSIKKRQLSTTDGHHNKSDLSLPSLTKTLSRYAKKSQQLKSVEKNSKGGVKTADVKSAGKEVKKTEKLVKKVGKEVKKANGGPKEAKRVASKDEKEVKG